MTTKKNLNNFLVMLVFLLATLCTAATGETLYVPGNHSTIQDAIDAADDGYEIEVAPGTYSGAINFYGKAVKLYSSGGAAVTTIDGGGAGTVVQCRNGEGPGTILKGFTITGGSTVTGGGGMRNEGSSPTVTNCTFTDNYANWHGAGMNNWNNSKPTVTGCTFLNNSTDGHGGGMRNHQSSPTVTDCVFTNNSAGSYSEGSYSGGRGGGMYNDDNSSPIVTDCTFSNNTGYIGGGMSNKDNCSPTVTDCVFTDNSTTSPQGGGGGGGMYNDNNCSPNVISCTFSRNTTSLYGGGIHNYISSSPTVTDCTFTDNSAVNNGGGMYNRSNSSPEVTNCMFTDNSADGNAGGMHNSNSNPTVTECTFTGNFAGSTGGMHNSNSSPTVTDCTFSGNSGTLYYGGGMQNSNSSPTVTNCTFTGNSAGWGGAGMVNWDNSSPSLTGCAFSNNSALWGGGMFNRESSPTVDNCTFTGNSASKEGGGMYNWEISSPTVTDCTFTGNSAGGGGGMYSSGSNPTVTNCTFSGNSATSYGGGMQNWNNSPTVINCTFTGNSASNSAGGMRNSRSNPTVTNCTFTGNSAGSSCGGMRNDTDSSTTAINCIFWGNTPNEICLFGGTLAISYSDVQGGTGQPWFGTGCIDTDPFFADSDGRLSPWSPCINAGDNLAVAGVATDLDGNPRIFHGIVDMGAYECMADPENTPPGQDVEVFDPGTGTMILFDTVASGGDTTIAITQDGPPPPTGLKLVPLGMYYEINTTAVYSDIIHIAILYDDTGLTAGQENTLKLRVYEDGEWVDITTVLDKVNNIIYGETYHLSFFAITTGILIDIKPGSDPNPINQGSNGLVPVAIFSSPEFDATQVDPTSISLAGANVAVRGKGKSMAHEEDVNGDGFVDLVVQVETQGFDDLGAGGTVELTGTTFGSEDIVGYDEVVIVPPDK